MGTVYQAVDRQTGEVVAVKVLHAKDVTDTERFRQEAALLAELRHPGIVRYVDHGLTSHGEPYIAMEWLSGETLEDRMLRGPLSPGHTARVARKVLDAVAAAHQRGVVHRDIKPSNIFLVGWRIDDVRILDFGIARRVSESKRFTKVGSTVGTPMYTAPEQARGERDVDGRVDIFSLGSVLFECVSGEPAFSGESPMEVMAKICIGAPPRLGQRKPGVPPELEALIEKMLIQDRNKRPHDAGELSVAFGKIAEQFASTSQTGENETPGPISTALTDAEQRVMTALIVSMRAANGQSSPSNGRLPPQRAASNVATSVLTPFAASNQMPMQPLERAIEPLGGKIDRMLDGSLLVTWNGQGSPREQATQVARVALVMRTMLPKAQMAIATGRAAIMAHLPVGPLIDDLSAMLDGFPPGQIRMDTKTARLLPARFNIEGTTDCPVLMSVSDLDERSREVRGRMAPFSGRDRELNTLVSLIDESIEESVSRVALVLAPAGMGKTRLRHELLLALKAETPPHVFFASAPVMRPQTRFPMLGRLIEAAGISMDRGTPVAQIQEAFITWLRARCAEAPVIVLLEHLQWADAACLQLIDAALRALADQPFSVVGLGRPEVDEQFPSLWAERSVERVRLPPLSRKAGQTLLRHLMDGNSTPEKEAFVLERWEGNPYFLEELARVALDGQAMVAPDGILAMVEARFDELPPELRKVLRAASVFGDESFALDALIPLVGEKHRREIGEWLEVLAERELIERDQSAGEFAYRFKHKLVRDAAYRMMVGGDRALARRIARAWLENAGRTLPECLAVPHSRSANLQVAS